MLSDRMGVNALARFDRDVLSHLHADTVILMMGINDIRIQNGQPERDLPLDSPSGLPPSLTRDACRGYQPTKSSLFDTVAAGEDAMSLPKQRPYTGRSAGHGISTSKSPSPSRQRQLRALSLMRT